MSGHRLVRAILFLALALSLGACAVYAPVPAYSYYYPGYYYYPAPVYGSIGFGWYGGHHHYWR